MIDASLTVTANAPASAPPLPQAAAQPGLFHDLLSELNPLQYVPVLGTIYRAVTGDTIPETARFAGSLVVSGLMGGPIGIGINVGTTMLEHLLGIDPEEIGGEVLAALGIGSGGKAAAAAVASGPPQPPATGPAVAAAAPPVVPDLAGGWTPAQLAAYGVRQTQHGELSRGRDAGADVLNGLELARFAQPN